jgi:hypothetical protein
VVSVTLNSKEETRKMNELQQCMQMEVMGGGVTGFFFCVVIGTAIYKMFRSGAGRVSIPKIISIEWR